MYTALYRLDTTQFQWEFAHLFEHLVIKGFYDWAGAKGYHPGLLGWLNGDTFDTCIYLDVGFYDPDVLALFKVYMDNLPQFSAKEIDCALALIVTEERAVITPLAPLGTPVRTISALVWTHGEEAKDGTKIPHSPEKLLNVQKSTAKYRDVTFEVYATGLTEAEAKVFQRYIVILQDIMLTGLQQRYALYLRGSSRLHDYTGGMRAVFNATVPRGVETLRNYEAKVRELFDTFDVAKHGRAITQHMRVFAQEPWLKSIPIEYYRNTEIITTTEEIARLASTRNLTSLMSKLQVLASPTEQRDRDLVV